MASIPVIESPCPIAGKQLPAGNTEHCTLCDRSVHNLDLMNERERVAFMSSCSGKVCVAYTVRAAVPRKRLAAAMAGAAAASLLSLPAAATDDSTLPITQGPPAGAMSPVEGARELPHCDELIEIWVGGVSHADQAEWADDGKEAPPDLPTIEDDGR